jgi:hypothetical protein
MINSSGRMTIEVLPQRDVRDRWEVQFSHDAPAGGMGQRASASGSGVLLKPEHNAPDLVTAVDPAMRFDDLRE